MDDHAGRQLQVDQAVIDAVLTGSRSMVAIATKSLGAAAEETTIAQYRALVVLASQGPRRIGDLAEALDVAPSTAGADVRPAGAHGPGPQATGAR